MHIQHLTLPTRFLSAQRDFYAQILGLEPLGLEVQAGSPEQVTFRVGRSLLSFRQDETEHGFTHVALDIPRNQAGAARRWLEARVPLLRDAAGHASFHPDGGWNSESVYFEDAGGNILELIARRGLKRERQDSFGPHSLLHVSEVGLVVPDVPEAVRRMGSLTGGAGLRPYLESSDTFTPLGDAHGMLIVVREGRGWFPAGRPAAPMSFELEFSEEPGHPPHLFGHRVTAPGSAEDTLNKP